MVTEKQSITPPEDTKRLLAVAALFDGDFSIDWLVELTEMRATKILNILEEGVQQGFLTKKKPGVFSFQAKCKSDFISGEVGNLRRRIVLLLMDELKDDGDKFKAVAPYLLGLSNDIETCRWLMKAGDSYVSAFQNEEALQCYGKVLQDLSSFHENEAERIFIDATLKYSKLSTARHDTNRTLILLQEATERAKRINDQASQALLEMHLAKNEWLGSRYRIALNHFQRGWSIAKLMNDTKLLRSATAFATFFLYWQGRFKEAVQNYEKSVPDVEKFPKGRFPLLAAITVGQCYAFTGSMTQALGMIDAILSHCLEKGDLSLASNAEGTIGSIMIEIRHIEEAVGHLENAMEKARKKHNYFVQILSNLTLSYAYYLLGREKEAITYLTEFLNQSNRVKMTVQIYPYMMELCWAMEEGKLRRIPNLSIAKECQLMLRGENIFLKGVAYRYSALLQRREGLDHKEILQSLCTSLKWLEESGHQIEVARTQLECARHYMWLGESEKARDILRRAAKILSPVNEALIPSDLHPLIEKPVDDKNLLSKILKLSQEIVSIRDNRDLVQKIISTVNRLTGAERGAIFLLEEEARPLKFHLRASKNITPEHTSAEEFFSSMNMIKEVAETGKGRILSTGLLKGSEGSGSQTIRSRICVPMILRDRVIGVLYHDNRLLNSAFDKSDLELLAHFAAVAALALDNAQAYEGIRRLNQKFLDEKLYYEEKHLQSLHFEDIIGESPAISHVLDQVNQVAPTDTTVLILGETGVGKELIASAIHRHSPRSKKPFIQVNCNALPESLIPSELFGHEKGAFTGATHRRAGRFELADGGTLFLDEIGELPLDIQIGLLRVLQNKEFERVGGTETLRSDFRLLVATNRDLEQAVKAQRVREDLYYRINVFPIRVPPLRERKEDIPLLAHYFLKVYLSKMKKGFVSIPQKEIDKLMEYDWPGNVRELENVIERGSILSSGPYFQVPELIAGHTQLPHNQTEINTLKDNERYHILRALERTGWKIRGPGGAAKLLDINPSTLSFRIKKLGIHQLVKSRRKHS